MDIFRTGLCLALCTLCATAGKAGPLALVGETPVETVRDAATISGTVVVGARVVHSKQSDEMRGEVPLPPIATGDLLCVSMLSANGLYEAHATYKAEADWQGGPVSLDYPSRHEDVLAPLGADELAIHASPGACEDRDTSRVFPVAWRPVAGESGLTLRLFINAFHADEVYVYVGAEAVEPVVCRPPASGARTAFDFVCDITLDAPGAPEIEINRVKGGRIVDPDTFTLIVGAAR